MRMTYGKARICVGPPGSEFLDDGWCYDSPEEAIVALANWNCIVEPEPNGWMRHPKSGRRRPGGDASKEYVLY